jgi:hypothetical protein
MCTEQLSLQRYGNFHLRVEAGSASLMMHLGAILMVMYRNVIHKIPMLLNLVPEASLFNAAELIYSNKCGYDGWVFMSPRRYVTLFVNLVQ